MTTGDGITPDITGWTTRATITVPQAAAICGIARQSAYRAIAAGELPSVRIGARVLVPVAPLMVVLGVPSGR